MKKMFSLALVALGMMAAMPSQAQIKFGLKGGLNITDMSMSKDKPHRFLHRPDRQVHTSGRWSRH